MKRNILLFIIGFIILLGFFVVAQVGVLRNENVRVIQEETGSNATSTSGENLPFVVPQGFTMTVFATGVTNARVIAFDPRGVILVSEPREGKIVALPDTDQNGKADKIITVLSGLNRAHGIVFHCAKSNNPEDCSLYVGETNQVSEFDYDAENLSARNKRKLVDLPSGGLHFTRSLLFMPSPNENTLLVSIGSSCNACKESDVRRAKVLAYDILTKKTEEFASGLRNSVFMQVHPVTGEIFATEMGRDFLGDNLPPDELNILRKGADYGWPFCYGKNIHDGIFEVKTSLNSCGREARVPSKVDLPAHSAPLGLAFIPEEGWPEDLWYQALVALHGSQDRSVPDGYKIVRVKLDSKGNYLGQNPIIEDFITGWIRKDGTKIGRSVDIKVLSGGTMYISDDQAGVIYKVTRK